jgi:hypothetical protein
MAARHGRAGTESFRRALAARDAARGAPTRPENSGAAPWPRCSPELFVHAIDVLRGPSGRAERAAGRGPTRHIRHFALTPQTLPRPTFVPGRVIIVAETRLNPLNVLG